MGRLTYPGKARRGGKSEEARSKLLGKKRVRGRIGKNSEEGQARERAVRLKKCTKKKKKMLCGEYLVRGGCEAQGGGYGHCPDQEKSLLARGLPFTIALGKKKGTMKEKTTRRGENAREKEIQARPVKGV